MKETMKETINFIQDHGEVIIGILTLLYELAVSIWPTSKNISILDNAIKIIRFIIPNRSKTVSSVSKIESDGTKTIPDYSKNHIIKMIVVFILCSVGSFAQLNTNVKSLNSYNTDSVTVRTNTASLQTAYTKVGSMYYNIQSNKWRVYENGTWKNLFSSTPTPAAGSNGQVQYNSGGSFAGAPGMTWTNATNTLQLGLTNALTLAPGVGSNFNMTMIGTGTFNLTGSTATTGNDIALSGGTGTTRGGNVLLHAGLATLEANYGVVTLDANSVTVGLTGHNSTTTATLSSAAGNNVANNAQSLTIKSGDGFGSSGNGNSGDINITTGTPHGSGTEGSININTNSAINATSIGDLNLTGGTGSSAQVVLTNDEATIGSTNSSLDCKSTGSELISPTTIIGESLILATPFKDIISVTATLNFPSTAAGAISDLTIGSTNFSVGDAVYVGAPSVGPTVGGYLAWVSSAGTVTVRYFNNGLVAAVDPASGTFRITGFHY